MHNNVNNNNYNNNNINNNDSNNNNRAQKMICCYTRRFAVTQLNSKSLFRFSSLRWALPQSI